MADGVHQGDVQQVQGGVLIDQVGVQEDHGDVQVGLGSVLE